MSQPPIRDDPPDLDLGHGVVAWFTFYRGQRAGLTEQHTNCATGEPCFGGVLFDLPATRASFPERSLWTVESNDPLTLSPSLLCRICGNHGWIRGGRWVPV